jgi:hypothetical protein
VSAIFIFISRLGINRVLALPAFCCLLIVVPFTLATRQQRDTLQLQHEGHTMKEEFAGSDESERMV